MKFVKAKAALDLGCGAGRDTAFLLNKGFRVTAVDKDPQVKEYLQKLPHQDKLQIVVSDFKTFKFGKYDLINSWFSLSFLPKDTFYDVMDNIKSAVRSNGLFIGNIFGVNDEWNKDKRPMTFLKKDDISRLFQGFRILKLIEEDIDGNLANGDPKHWHLFMIVAKKEQ